MTQNKCLRAVTRRAGGRFIDVDDVLMALLSDPDCRDRRCWPEVFGQLRIAPTKADPRAFIARALREHVERLPPEA